MLAPSSVGHSLDNCRTGNGRGLHENRVSADSENGSKEEHVTNTSIRMSIHMFMHTSVRMCIHLSKRVSMRMSVHVPQGNGTGGESIYGGKFDDEWEGGVVQVCRTCVWACMQTRVWRCV